jgi:hypothetical protein
MIRVFIAASACLSQRASRESAVGETHEQTVERLASAAATADAFVTPAVMAAVLHLGGKAASLDTRLKTRQSLFEKLSRLLPVVAARVLDHDLARRHRIEAPVHQAAREVPRPPGVEALLWWRRDRIAHQ